MSQFEASENAIRLPDILSALSFALDLTEGAVAGHAIRSTILGMRIASEVKISDRERAALYYALQLKDVGCSSNAARMATLFGGDDRRAKAHLKVTDYTGLLQMQHAGSLKERAGLFFSNCSFALKQIRNTWATVLPHGTTWERCARILELGRNAEANTRELLTIRCDRGALIMRKLEMSDLSCNSVRSLDERWDGSGYPCGLAGQQIPVLARISAIAQTLDCFASEYGTAAALQAVQRRSGSWFDPALVRAVVQLERAGHLWQDCEPGSEVDRSRAAVMRLAPSFAPLLEARQIDAICEAFADVVDAKSPFTYRHSMGVTEAASALAIELGLEPWRQQMIRRAALLHDIGKLGVPNSIIDKTGQLTVEERTVIMTHPELSRQILGRITGFETLARIASEHHERLDGKGYPYGLKADELSLESRILMVADTFSALAEQRPYREALPIETVMQIIQQSTPNQFDEQVVQAMGSIGQRWKGAMPQVFSETSGLAVCELGTWSGSAAPVRRVEEQPAFAGA